MVMSLKKRRLLLDPVQSQGGGGGVQPTGPLSFSTAGSQAPRQGTPDNFFVTFANGITTAYCCLVKSGVEETVMMRDAITTAFPITLLTPQSSGSYTVRAYSAASGGTLIGESASFTVAAAPALASLPLAADAPWAAFGDSTIALGTSADNPFHTSINHGCRVIQMAAYRIGAPLDVWPNYQAGTGQGANSVGGLIDAVVGDQTGSGGGSGGSAIPGYTTRVNRSLQRKGSALVFIQVTINDTLNGLTAAASVANLTAMANRFLLAGVRVHFLLERPYDGYTADNKTTRADKNSAIVAYANATNGASYTDLSPVYGTTYNATSWPALDTSLIVGYHPGNKGGMAEAEYLINDLVTKGIISASNNYARDAVFANNDLNILPYPTFIGTNGAPIFSNGASGTLPNGIKSISGPGASLSSAVASIEANADISGGSLLRIDITPQTAAASTAIHNFTVTHFNSVAQSGLTGYVGWLEEMCEIEVSADTEALVSSIQHRAAFGSGVQLSQGEHGKVANDNTAAGAWPVQSGPRKLWARNIFYCDGRSATPVVDTVIETKPSGKSAVATVRIRRQAIRKISGLHSRYGLPNIGSIAQNGSPASGGIPVRVTLPTSGPKPTGVRFIRYLTTGGGGTMAGEVILGPTDTTADFTFTGLTAGTSYVLFAVPIYNGGVLGGDYGRTHHEASTGAPITVLAA